MMIPFFYHIILFLGDSILLRRFKLGNEVLDLLGLDAIFSGLISDGDFILDDVHEF